MRRRSGAGAEGGAVAVEFALLLPLMIIILFAIIEFGIAITHVLAYASGAREGGRYAAVHCRPEGEQCTKTLIGNRIQASIPAGYPLDYAPQSGSPGLVVSQADCSTTPGLLVTVSWQQVVPISVPFLPDLTWTVNPSGTFRCE